MALRELRTKEYAETVLVGHDDGISDTLPGAVVDVRESSEVGALENGWVCPAQMVVANLQDTFSVFSLVLEAVLEVDAYRYPD